MNHSLRLCCAAMLLAAASAGVNAQEATWESPPVSTQLEMDDVLIPIGKGAIFCPAMTDPDNEPVYGVLRDGKIVEDARMGHRIPLAPGTYTVVLGSGTRDQMIRKRVRVEEAATTLIKADWSGLVIDVINESRAHVREYYELFNLETGVSCGIGQGVEEGMDEKLFTWLLPPGRYKVVRSGDNVNAVVNFGTIRLLAGELAQTNLVIDSKSGNFLGFGFLTDVRQASRPDKKWRTLSELSGNALFHYTPSSETGTESDASFTATVQWLTDARYENGRHIIPIWSNLEEGLSMDEDRDLRKYVDKAELKLTYIYRLSDMLSPYVRVAAETRFFPAYHRFDEPGDFVKVDSAGDTLQLVENAEDIKLGKGLSPAYFKQGAGITSILVKSMPVNINIRTGYGARQTISGGAHLFNSETNVLSPIIQTDTSGMEFLLLGDLRLGRYIIFNTEFDILMPKMKKGDWIYDGENRLRINLSSNVSIMLTMEYWKDENVRNVQSRYQTLLRFSKYL